MNALNPDRIFGQDRIEKIANEVARRAKARVDLVAPRSKLAVTVTENEAPDIALVVQNGKDRVLPFTRPALLQLVSSVDVPATFVSRLAERGHLDLIAATTSELLAREGTTPKGEPRKHLVRELDGRVDGFLSDRYRAVSNDDLLAVTLQEAERLECEVWDFSLTATHFRIKLIAPGLRQRVEHLAPKGEAHGWAKFAGDDWLNAAVTIGNSENGHGRLFGNISTWRQVCRNFAVIERGVARVHLGSKLEEGTPDWQSDETKRKADELLVSQVRDVIRAAFDPERFAKLVGRISAATARGTGETGVVEVVDAAIKLYGLPAERKEAILESFLRAGKSQYFLAQAVTEQANPDRAGDLPDDARNAIEDAGGKILALGAHGWEKFLAGAIKPEMVEADA